MLAHDLALWLLSCPNEEVQFEKVHRTWTHDELMEIASGDFREKEIAGFDDSGGYYRTVYDVQFTHHGNGAEIRVRVGDPDAMTEQGYEDKPLEGPPELPPYRNVIAEFIDANPEWGCRHARYAGVGTLRCGEMSCPNYINKHR